MDKNEWMNEMFMNEMFILFSKITIMNENILGWYINTILGALLLISYNANICHGNCQSFFSKQLATELRFLNF